jgi:hypothetical protein
VPFIYFYIYLWEKKISPYWGRIPRLPQISDIHFGPLVFPERKGCTVLKDRTEIDTNYRVGIFLSRVSVAGINWRCNPLRESPANGEFRGFERHKGDRYEAKK